MESRRFLVYLRSLICSLSGDEQHFCGVKSPPQLCGIACYFVRGSSCFIARFRVGFRNEWKLDYSRGRGISRPYSGSVGRLWRSIPLGRAARCALDAWRLEQPFRVYVRRLPPIDLERLARLKLTERERDYSFIGEIARKLPAPRGQMLWSRSARDLIRLTAEHPQLSRQLWQERPLLSQIQQGRDALEAALDAERRELFKVNEHRLEKYALAAQAWTRIWPRIKASIAGLPLKRAHEIVVESAQVLPQEVL